MAGVVLPAAITTQIDVRDVSAPIVVSGIGIGCQPHKPQKARHTNVLFGQLDYSIKKRRGMILHR